MTIQEILPYNNNKSNKKMDLDIILPFIILPILLLVATLSRAVTLTVMIFIGMGALYVISRPRHRNRSPFFYSWTLSSGLYMFLIFEMIVMDFWEITYYENVVFLSLITFTCYFFYKMKSTADFELATGTCKGNDYSPVLTSDSHYCKICEIEVSEGYFHSIWWDCCVLKPNYGYFLLGHMFTLATLLYGTNLTLTTICQPYIFYGPILMPEDCSDVYNEFYLALCFVTCVYSLGYVSVICLVFLHQLLKNIPKYGESQWQRIVHAFNV
ncbi:palmitoyltransferase ZDHHC23-A [Amyelois transitella]|uniref:palmitoyltransferase ZDHHC23-A n=1 Tax=Amyelois transitella TaxID=680683 RepID=UPI00067E4783|nr:palmitoyltransferase ZDHHC23-A [Amyelois transitella]